jgi:16S rRNA (uracil1498-N3)-methyltransferase
MRAIYNECLDEKKLQKGEEILVSDAILLNHLINVIRIKKSESVLVLNGRGLCINTNIINIEKKFIRLKVNNWEHKQNPSNFSLALAITKKDALYESIRIATETGINNIFLINTQYSNKDYQVNEKIFEKLKKISINSLIQSNNLYLPQIYMQQDLFKLDLSTYDHVHLFHSKSSHHKNNFPNIRSNQSNLILIGPEGGFSDEEISRITCNPSLLLHYLNTPILKTPTAIAASIGFLHRSIIDT